MRSLSLEKLATPLVSVICIGIGLISSILLARGLPIDDRGEVASILVVSSILSFLLLFGLDDIFTARIQKNRLRAEIYECVVVDRSLMFASVLICCSLLIFSIIPEMGLYIAIVCAVGFASAQKNLVLSHTLGADGQRQWNLLRLLQPTLYTAALIGLYLSNALSVENSALSMAVSCSALYIFFYIKRKSGKQVCGVRSTLKTQLALFKKGSYIFVSRLLSQLSGRADMLMIMFLGTEEMLGYYSVAAGIALAPSGVIAVQIKTIIASIGEHSGTSLRNYMQLTMLRVFLIVLALSIVACILMQLLIPTLYGDRYTPSIPIAQLMLLTTPIYAITMFVSGCLVYLDSTKPLAKGELLSLIAIVAFSYFWIPVYGSIGAVFALIIGYSIGALVVSAYALARAKGNA